MTGPESSFSEPADAVFSRRIFLRSVGALGVALVSPADHLLRAREAYADDCEGPGELLISMETREVLHRTDILREGYWGNLDGAQVTHEGLVLTDTGLSFVNKRAGNITVPDPPVNEYGTRLAVKGDWSIGARMAGQAPVTLRLYSAAPPARFDDFNYDVAPEVDCVISGNTLTVNMWEGAQQSFQKPPTLTRTFGFENSSVERRLEVRREGGALVFLANGKHVAVLPSPATFGSDQLWIGLDSNNGTAVVRDITAEPLNGGRMAMVRTDTLEVKKPLRGGLQQLARDRIRIGSAASLYEVVSSAEAAKLFLGGEVGSWTPENGLKPQDVQPREGEFTFGTADALVTLAGRNKIAVHGHALLYDKAEPQWMSELPHGTPAEKARAQAVLEEHVRTVVGHFKGRIAGWDVVNEPIDGFNEGAHLRQNHWYQALGPAYIAIALRAAHVADPNAQLWLNDFGLETNPQGRGQVMLGLVQNLLENGVPIHGVGIQGHVYQMPRDTIKPDVLEQIIVTAKNAGLKIRISELDVVGTDPVAQAKQYAAVLEVCLKHGVDMTTWGLMDQFGSTAGVNSDNVLVPGSALLYDRNGKPKLARRAMVDVLRNAS